MAFFVSDPRLNSGTRTGTRLGWTEQPKLMLPSTLYGVTSSEETVDSPGGVHCSLNGHEAALVALWNE